MLAHLWLKPKRAPFDAVRRWKPPGSRVAEPFGVRPGHPENTILIHLVRNDEDREEMTLLLIIPAWFVLLGLVVGLCTAARIGDTLESREPGIAAGPAMTSAQADDHVPLTRQAGDRGGRITARKIAA
jgi:hypothetical protein